MAFAVSTQALAAKVALNGKTLNVRKSSVKAARNVTVRAAAPSECVPRLPSEVYLTRSRPPPNLETSRRFDAHPD